MMEVDRRSFVSGAAAAVAGSALAAGATVALADETAPATVGVTADDKWAFEIAPDPVPEDQIAETVEADVIVVGAGMSGLVSAVSCAEGGLDVVLVTASEGAVSRGGSNNAVYSTVMEELGLPRLDPEFYRLQYLANGGNFNPSFWYKYYNNSETAMNWLVEKATAAGIKTTIESGTSYPEDDPMWTPAGAHAFYVDDSELEGTVGTGEAHIAEELARILTEDLGAEIRWQTVAEQLVREDDGRVDAVVATDADGAYVKFVGTKAVILATGDFSHDKDMMTRYCPECVDLCGFDGAVNYDAGLAMGGLMPGTGQKMGLWVGAAWQKTQPNVFMLGRPNFPADNPYTSHTGLMVDRNGKRFMNEDVLGGTALATVLHLPGGVCYPIWGTNRAAEGAPWGKPNYAYGAQFESPEEFIETWDNDSYGFGIVKSDTLEGLIEELGLPAETIDTINRYNELCEAGEDSDFYKSVDKLIGVTEAPFYGCAFQPGFLTSLGGLRTNIDLQVCDADDNPIPGLFNVGSMIGDFYSGTYTFAMEGVNYGACCVTLPHVLGRDLAAGKFDA
jgi:succinate dehydrogenase/fumarate reductase flavoprotein subunit